MIKPHHHREPHSTRHVVIERQTEILWTHDEYRLDGRFQGTEMQASELMTEALLEQSEGSGEQKWGG